MRAIGCEFFSTGGEAASHIGVYLPDQRAVFVGDEVQGPDLPATPLAARREAPQIKGFTSERTVTIA